jgi:hypothetical protein
MHPAHSTIEYDQRRRKQLQSRMPRMLKVKLYIYSAQSSHGCSSEWMLSNVIVTVKSSVKISSTHFFPPSGMENVPDFVHLVGETVNVTVKSLVKKTYTQYCCVFFRIAHIDVY